MEELMSIQEVLLNENNRPYTQHTVQLSNALKDIESSRQELAPILNCKNTIPWMNYTKQTMCLKTLDYTWVLLVALAILILAVLLMAIASFRMELKINVKNSWQSRRQKQMGFRYLNFPKDRDSQFDQKWMEEYGRVTGNNI
jgi:hypothetical protein